MTIPRPGPSAEGAAAPLILADTPAADATGARLALRLGWTHLDAGAHDGDLPAALLAAFRAGRPVLALCRPERAIHALAPWLGTVAPEPPVIVLPGDGAAPVALLGLGAGAAAL
ncbi:hypothetical protein ICN82_19970, partial [Mangrovicoccus sp. HB182678]|nr:hypothetical protein [Mangrovicoccus algicola]